MKYDIKDWKKSALYIDDYLGVGAQRLREHYNVNEAQADASMIMVAAWYDMKSKAKDGDPPVILPQIADWLVHELIADTIAYSVFSARMGWQNSHSMLPHSLVERDDHSSIEHTLCADEHMYLSGHNMHSLHHTMFSEHVMMSPHNVVEHVTLPNHQFYSHVCRDHVYIAQPTAEHISLGHIYIQKTKPHLTVCNGAGLANLPWSAYWETHRRLREEYGIDPLDYGMVESGWLSPAYAMRHPRFKRLRAFKFTQVQRDELNELRAGLSEKVKSIEIERWLNARLMRRFGMSKDAAELAAVLYQKFLDDGAFGDQDGYQLPDIVASAWFEHVLATNWYQRDCDALFGAFLHRPYFDWSENAENAPDWLLPVMDLSLAKPLLARGWSYKT